MAAGQQKLVHDAFLWSIAAVYLFAFASLYVQIPGLYGKNGILPAKLVLSEDDNSGFKEKPTLLWYTPQLGLDTETGMEFLSLLGIVISLLAMTFASWRNNISFLILWFLYFSLYQVGQTFLWFQWDILLLESGFLAVLVAPFTFFKRQNARDEVSHSNGVALWLVKWLLFRLMFASGVVKLTSRCPTWWGLTALNWHYESQCIPTPLAWYAHQLPEWFQRLSVVLTYVIEIAVPFLFFAPVRSLRIFSFYSQAFLMTLIFLSGNYNFFNILTVVLCLPLLDDSHLYYLLPSWLVKKEHDSSPEPYISSFPVLSFIKKVCRRLSFLGTFVFLFYWTKKLFALEYSEKKILKSRVVFSQDELFVWLEKVVPITIWIGLCSLLIEIQSALVGVFMDDGMLRKIWSSIKWAVFSIAALCMFGLSLVPHTVIDYKSQTNLWPVIKRWHQKVDHWQIFHSYGLFRRMTGVGGRPEIIIEGSNHVDGPWKEYNFLYKPGNLFDAPSFCDSATNKKAALFSAPHQPRLDWQMWFAALGSYHHNPWFVHFVYRLLVGQKEVLDLLGKNPFPKRPPKYIRCLLYKYHYTLMPRNISSPIDVLHNSKLVQPWWWREDAQEYLPILEKNEPTLKKYLMQVGLLQEKPRQENTSGSLHKVIVHLRSIVRTMDPLRFIMTLFVCGVFMGVTLSRRNNSDFKSRNKLLQNGHLTRSASKSN